MIMYFLSILLVPSILMRVLLKYFYEDIDQVKYFKMRGLIETYNMLTSGVFTIICVVKMLKSDRECYSGLSAFLFYNTFLIIVNGLI